MLGRCFAAAVAIAFCNSLTSCSRCDGGPSPGQEDADTSQRLVWERVPLGQAKDALEKVLPELMEESGGALACEESIELSVVDIEEKRIEVRFSEGHRVERCTRRGTLAGDPSTSIRLKADLVDGLLARAEIVVPKKMEAGLAQELSRRFGTPEEAELVGDGSLADPVTHRFWLPQKDVVWTLSQSHREGVAFVLQHLGVSRKLSPPRRPAKPGTPVSLDDLGFGSGEVDTELLEQLAKDSGETTP